MPPDKCVRLYFAPAPGATSVAKSSGPLAGFGAAGYIHPASFAPLAVS
jgi:hypothetical protein